MELVIHKTGAALTGEMVTAEVINAPAGASFNWYSSNESIVGDVNDNWSKIYLDRGAFDNYTVYARVYPTRDSGYHITLSKSIAVKRDHFTFPASLPANEVTNMEGDQLKLQPVFMPDGSLSFSFFSLNKYNCFISYIVPENVNISNGNISATFNKVWSPGNCQSKATKAWGKLFTNHTYQDGFYTIDLTFNNQLYQGSLTVSNNGNNGKRYVYQSPRGALTFLNAGPGTMSYTENTANGKITTTILE
ncbi:MAG TPA: hypothetical protein VF008_27535 [Niastella sp.]